MRQSGQPLHYAEITRLAVARGLVASAGQTPERTMNAAITTSLAGDNSPFVRTGRGVYGLAEWAAGPAEPPAPTTPAPPPPKTYCNYKDAARKVLSALGQPAHYKEITRRALEAGYINPEGLTPEATMGAQLYSDIKRRGAASAFRREDRGVFFYMGSVTPGNEVIVTEESVMWLYITKETIDCTGPYVVIV